MNLLSNYILTQPVTQAQQRSLSHPVWKRGRQERADSRTRRNIHPTLVPPFPNLISVTQSYSTDLNLWSTGHWYPSESCLASPAPSHLINQTETNLWQGRPFPVPTMVLLDCSGSVVGRRQLQDRTSIYKEPALENTATAAKMGKNTVRRERNSATALSDGLAAFAWSLQMFVFLRVSPETVEFKSTGKGSSVSCWRELVVLE